MSLLTRRRAAALRRDTVNVTDGLPVPERRRRRAAGHRSSVPGVHRQHGRPRLAQNSCALRSKLYEYFKVLFLQLLASIRIGQWKMFTRLLKNTPKYSKRIAPVSEHDIHIYSVIQSNSIFSFVSHLCSTYLCHFSRLVTLCSCLTHHCPCFNPIYVLFTLSFHPFPFPLLLPCPIPFASLLSADVYQIAFLVDRS